MRFIAASKPRLMDRLRDRQPTPTSIASLYRAAHIHVIWRRTQNVWNVIHLILQLRWLRRSSCIGLQLHTKRDSFHSKLLIEFCLRCSVWSVLVVAHHSDRVAVLLQSLKWPLIWRKKQHTIFRSAASCVRQYQHAKCRGIQFKSLNCGCRLSSGETNWQQLDRIQIQF